jgi:hypothetical protein
MIFFLYLFIPIGIDPVETNEALNHNLLSPPLCALFAWLISHQPAVHFSHNKPATSNQPAVLFSQNKPASTISHQPTEQTLAQLRLPRVGKGVGCVGNRPPRRRSTAARLLAGRAWRPHRRLLPK